MALTRKFLAAMGIDNEKIDEIITAHSETVEALKEQRDSFKAEADNLTSVTRDRDDLKAKLAGFEEKVAAQKKELSEYKTKIADAEAKTKAAEDRTTELTAKIGELEESNKTAAAESEKKYEALKSESDKKYEDLKSEYDTFKTQTAAEAQTAKKVGAYSSLLRDMGIAEKRVGAIVKVTDLSGLELDDDGSIKDADKWSEKINTDWADFIPTQGTEGAKTPTPPANNGAKMSKDEILKIKDPEERQRLIAENHELFGF